MRITHYIHSLLPPVGHRAALVFLEAAVVVDGTLPICRHLHQCRVLRIADHRLALVHAGEGLHLSKNTRDWYLFHMEWMRDD